MFLVMPELTLRYRVVLCSYSSNVLCALSILVTSCLFCALSGKNYIYKRRTTDNIREEIQVCYLMEMRKMESQSRLCGQNSETIRKYEQKEIIIRTITFINEVTSI